MNNALLARTQEEELAALTADNGSVGNSSAGGSGVDAFSDVEKETVTSRTSEGGKSSSEHSSPGDDSSSGDGGGSSIIQDDDHDEKKIVKGDEKNPWSKNFIGIPVNYFSVGLIYGGSVSVLYPILIIQHGVTSAFYAASASLVTLFWSYKILFGILCDCFPVRGQKVRGHKWKLCGNFAAASAAVTDS